MNKVICLLAVFLLVLPAWAKKKEPEKKGLKKVIAIGAVNSGMFAFQGGSPTDMNNLLQNQVKQQIDGTSRYTGLIMQSGPEGEANETEDDFLNQMQTKLDAGGQMTPEETLKYSETMMKQQMAAMGPMMQQMGMGGFGGASFKPVAAQGLLTFAVTTGQGGFDTGAVLGTIGGIFTGGSMIGDMGTQSVKLSLTCVMQDPETGMIIDQNIVKTKSTKFTRLGGISTISDSTNQDEAYDKLYKKAVEKCVKWMDDHLKDQPWEGKIFKVEGANVFLNAGSSAGVTDGMQFALSKRGAVKGTGLEFGKAEQGLGTATASTIYEGYTILSVPASVAVRVGTIARPLETPVVESSAP